MWPLNLNNDGEVQVAANSSLPSKKGSSHETVSWATLVTHKKGGHHFWAL